jgi:hypothetical protein
MTAALAVVAIGGGAILAGPAIAHEGKHAGKTGEQSESTAGKRAGEGHRGEWRSEKRAMKKLRREARRALRTCDVSDALKLGVEDSTLLALIREVLDERLDAGDIDQERADAKWNRFVTMVTVRVRSKEARWAPVLALFGADSPKVLRDLAEEAGGFRDLMEVKKVSWVQLKTAKRAGKVASYTTIVDLCTSGDDAEEAPAPAPEPEPEPAPVS